MCSRGDMEPQIFCGHMIIASTDPESPTQVDWMTGCEDMTI